MRTLSTVSVFSLLISFSVNSIAAPMAANTFRGADNRIIHIDMVVLEQTIKHNRLGAELPDGQIYALARDVVPTDHPMTEDGVDITTPVDTKAFKPGEVRLRTYKRPRPIVLRANEGDILEIEFTNLLPRIKNIKNIEEVFLMQAGVQIMGLDWYDPKSKKAIPQDNAKRINPGEKHIYYFIAHGEGVFMLYSPNGKSIPNSQLDLGLFGSVNIQPKEAEWYRSQVTHNDLTLATYKVSKKFFEQYWLDDSNKTCLKRFTSKETGLPDNVTIQRQWIDDNGRLICPQGGEETRWEVTFIDNKNTNIEKKSSILINKDGLLNSQAHQPILNYNAMYPRGHVRENSPILNMLSYDTKKNTYELAHTDLTAMITGPNAGRFPYYLNSPSFNENPAAPDRRQPYREFTIAYHISPKTQQAFESFNTGPLVNTLTPGEDGFAVNYGIAGIAPEIYANRINVGPMGINQDGVDLLFEEFFLSAWAVGDPAVLVDTPANVPGRANKALYPDDPSNVYHSYMRDHVKFRILNTGSVAPHVHHQHAHQWLHTPNSDSSHYLDSQMINPGSTYTLEMVYNGSGNRNQTVGDSIFHCHIYPHFAQGMWAMWRVHDVFEAGTELNSSGIPIDGARALPDGEIISGTPIPGLVPLPSLAIAPIPAEVALIDNGRRISVKPKGMDQDNNPVYDNPGFPFFIPGVAGHRAPHPPLDFAWKENANNIPELYDANELAEAPFRKEGERKYLDGGLPRHIILDGEIESEFHTRWDFSKEIKKYIAMEIPETGTAVEKAAMAAHATRTHASYQPDGLPGNFILNGLPPAPGAPYAAPEVNDDGNSTFNERRYKAAVIQTDVVFSKEGWHYPQQRFITLLEDVKDTVEGIKPPEPFFFRANTGETIEFWHTNLVPNYYELDDFQVRTPTDILGQHIHLVKFDVTSSDGAANGFNYEDGTFSPDEVRSRINAINKNGGLYHFDHATQFMSNKQSKLTVSNYKKDYGTTLGKPPAGQDWNGAQTTIQRFDTDPLLNNQGEDRTLRTVFTHDHYGPSTHQQVGLYGALLVEPEGSTWFDAVTGAQMPSSQRHDGGPTSWQAIIETNDSEESYREFAIAMGDLQLAYKKDSRASADMPCNDSKKYKTEKDKTNCWFRSNIWFTTTNNDYQKSLNQQTIPPNLRQEFTNQGAVLNITHDILTEAKVTVIEKGKRWKIIRNHVDEFLLELDGNNINVRTKTITQSWSDFAQAIYPPTAAQLPQVPNATPNPAFAPFPTIISDPGGSGNIGTWVANYRTEPLDARIQTGNATADTNATDPAFAYASIERQNAVLNKQPKLGSKIGRSNFTYPKKSLVPEGKDGVQPTDPYTPLLRAYANDKIEVRAIVGAVDSIHSFHIEGVNWEAEPSSHNSGLRDTQGMGISEHFEMLFQLPAAPSADTLNQPFTDYLYSPSASSMGGAKGTWGIMRAYNNKAEGLAHIKNNPPGKTTISGLYSNPEDVIPREFNVDVSLKETTKDDKTSYSLDFSVNGNTPSSPLILRAAAGEWIEITINNKLTQQDAQKLTTQWGTDQSSVSSSPEIKPYHASANVGINPMLISYNAATQSGLNIGFNPISTVKPNESKSFLWYAGNISLDENNQRVLTPIEFGGVNLVPSDPLLQQSYGLFGALIIEPEGSTWPENQTTTFTAVISDQANNPLFTEIVVSNGQSTNAQAKAGSQVRLRVLNPNGGTPGNVSDNPVVFAIEGHNWQEEPFTNNSTVIGHNPVTQTMGTQQITALESYNLILEKAGGEKEVTGEYDFYFYPKGPVGKENIIGTLTVK